MFSTPAISAGFLLPSNMSEENDSSPENLPTPAAASETRVRKISTPRPKKVAKSAAPAAKSAAEPAPAEIVQAVVPDHSDAPEPASSESDWPEPEAASTGNPSQSEGAKRKRRRRKGKGKGDAPQNAAAPVHEHSIEAGELSEAPRQPAAPPQQKPQPPQHQPQRPKVDPELLTKMAWKIYLAEVSEEGVALIGDNDAKDLSRRCFRLAEIFVEEQMRRR